MCTCNATKTSSLCLSWFDSVHVQVWNLSSHLNALTESETEGKGATSPVLTQAPAANFAGHKDEGYAIDWSPATAGRLLSGIGSDDGTFSIRDLRLIKDGDAVVAHFEYHKHPITSIEWSAHEASTLAVSSSDNQLTIWDLSLEKDAEEEAEFRAQTKEEVNTPQDLPPQLLFVHQGQKNLKELHWHNQISVMISSTAADGFNMLMPYNIQNTLPYDLAA
ncbi:unnamed protein product [Arabis nemorensis]|uniref:Uncharacterized protein n=1 Tax=Arabis nemorensis TaxID=586526 RepID=A0A565BD99_9BRAS|nr:unnamed protein product [Arabis nemorensis]